MVNRLLSVFARNLYFGELFLEFRKNRLCNFFRRAVAFDPISALILCSVIGCRSKPFCHSVGIDLILNFLRKLFFQRPSFAFNNKRLRDVFPIHNSITSHFCLPPPFRAAPPEIIYNLVRLDFTRGCVEGQWKKSLSDRIPCKPSRRPRGLEIESTRDAINV